MDRIIRLLYAEDDPEWADLVRKMLGKNGFVVEIAENGNVALDKFKQDLPDMVLLDIDMPGRNGWELIRELKIRNEWIPVVLYSSFYESKQLSGAFGLGAEDFISKSCLPEEFVDRLKALYSRAVARNQQPEVFQLSERTVFHATTGILLMDGHKEILKSNESVLLAVLCRSLNKKVTTKELCEAIWGREMMNDSKQGTLKNLITNLRKALSGDPAVEIANKRWIGYYLTATSDNHPPG